MQAYCVKCRARKEMKDPKPITMKNGICRVNDGCQSEKALRVDRADNIFTTVNSQRYYRRNIRTPVQKTVQTIEREVVLVP